MARYDHLKGRARRTVQNGFYLLSKHSADGGETWWVTDKALEEAIKEGTARKRGEPALTNGRRNGERVPPRRRKDST